MPVRASGEERLIRRLARILGPETGSFYDVGIGDDAAVRRCGKNERLVFTADSMVQDIHFSLKYMSFREIGYRAMAVNLSDCAAMGAIPDSALVQVICPLEKPEAEKHICELYRGLNDSCRKWKLHVVGGNLSRGGKWIIDITLIGRLAPGDRCLVRTGARPGDRLWVTRATGESRAGLCALNKWGRKNIPLKYRGYAIRHIRPEPRIKEGRNLCASSHVHALMDISDGLLKDCAAMARESGVGMEIVLPAGYIPAEMENLAARLGENAYHWAMGGGEDYELLFAASGKFNPEKPGMGSAGKFRCIGRAVSSFSGVRVFDFDGTRRSSEPFCTGWDHTCTKGVAPG